MTPKDAILLKIVLKCVKECLILKYKYIQNPWYSFKLAVMSVHILLDVVSKSRHKTKSPYCMCTIKVMCQHAYTTPTRPLLTWDCTTDTDQSFWNLHHLYLGMGLQLGYSGFPAIKIIVICQVPMYCDLSVKVNTREMRHGSQRLWTHFVCVCFCMSGRQKPEYPRAMPDDAITRSNIGVLGYPVCICGLHSL